MRGLHNWEHFKRAHRDGGVRIIWREGPLISVFCNDEGLEPPWRGKKEWLIRRMLASEKEFKRVHNRYDIYEA